MLRFQGLHSQVNYKEAKGAMDLKHSANYHSAKVLPIDKS